MKETKIHKITNVNTVDNNKTDSKSKDKDKENKSNSSISINSDSSDSSIISNNSNSNKTSSNKKETKDANKKSGKKSNNKDGVKTKEKKEKQCEHCKTTVSKLWRLGMVSGKHLCNACGLYEKAHSDTGAQRPLKLIKRKQQDRKRYPKAGQNSKQLYYNNKLPYPNSPTYNNVFNQRYGAGYVNSRSLPNVVDSGHMNHSLYKGNHYNSHYSIHGNGSSNPYNQGIISNNNINNNINELMVNKISNSM
eukprot:Pgem_evm1s17206